MSTQTEHLHLDLREAADIFNPLSSNANFESLDNIIYEIQTKGGVPTYTTTASANLLKLSQNPTPNVTVFKFVAAGDANTWSYQETVNNIVALDGKQKTVKGGEMYVAWVNSANAMVVIAWPDVVNAQTFDGKGPAEWATTEQLDAVNQTADNATTTALAAATVANNALEVASKAGLVMDTLWQNPNPLTNFIEQDVQLSANQGDYKFLIIQVFAYAGALNPSYNVLKIGNAKTSDDSNTFISSIKFDGISSRPVRSNGNGVLHFGMGRYCNWGSTAGNFSNAAVPGTIYGVK